jgi:CDP-4-dehydro-6-deoxyglucose reductase
VLQKKIQSGEMASFDGMVTVESLRACYPDVQLEDTAEFKRVSQIKERALPDAEVLSVRLAELSKTLANNQAQVKQFNNLLGRLWEKLDEIKAECSIESHVTLENLKLWIKQEVAYNYINNYVIGWLKWTKARL